MLLLPVIRAHSQSMTLLGTSWVMCEAVEKRVESLWGLDVPVENASYSLAYQLYGGPEL